MKMTGRIILCLLFTAQLTAGQQPAWPEPKAENKPWTRWWWPGSIAKADDLTSAMKKYSDAGLGGLEITVIYGVKGEEDRFIQFLSPDWMRNFIHVLGEGQKLGLGIDLATGSGWPFGGPWVGSDDACKNINLKTWKVSGGEKTEGRIEYIQQPLIRPVGQHPDITHLVEPYSKNKDLQLNALDQIRFEKPLPLVVLMAYSDSGKVLNITRYVNGNGSPDWTAPPGNWTVYGLFRGWHGKQVERAGPGGEGDVIDHFSSKAVNNYLRRFDEAFKGQNIKGLRAYFNDSYEVDDASGQADWTNDFLYEFRARRGYDLTLHLPALFQNDDAEKNARVLSDYRQTVSDLLLEKFTATWSSWANRQGKFTRNQAHGSPGNILDLYAASNIPETEGSEITRFKFASSAANVTGKKYVSAEAATWLGEHFLSTLDDIRQAVDLFFLGGVNHIFYHGTCFSPADEPWPGFLFYAAVELNPSNPLWNDFPALNSYITRIQSFMQSGRSDNDILFYFPISDRYAEKGRGMLEHFSSLSPAFDGSYFKKGAELMLEKGFAYDYISDLQLKNTLSAGSLLETGNKYYKALLVPQCKYMPFETFSRILELAGSGATVIFYGSLPETVSGFLNYGAKELEMSEIKAAIDFRQVHGSSIMKARVGKGTVIAGDDLPAMMALAGIRRESLVDQGIQFIRRRTEDGSVYFIKAQQEKDFDGWLPLNVRAAGAALYNPASGESGLLKCRKGKNGSSEVYLRMSHGQTFLIRTYDNKPAGDPFPFYIPCSQPFEVRGKWNVGFITGGPELPPSKEMDSLRLWTALEGDPYASFSGTARYSVRFDKPGAEAEAWSLDLGKVFTSVKVTLNGRDLGALIGPDFRITFDDELLKESNTLELDVSNLMANRIAYMDRNGIEWKRFYNVNMAARLKENNRNGVFDASAWKPLDSGLAGPVTLTALKRLK